MSKVLDVNILEARSVHGLRESCFSIVARGDKTEEFIECAPIDAGYKSRDAALVRISQERDIPISPRLQLSL